MDLEQIEVKGVELRLDGTKLIQGLDFNFFKNEILCLLGPNGAGKTLTNKMLGLLYEVDQGTISWDGEIVNPPQDQETKIDHIRNIGYMSQKPVFVKRSLEKNIELPLIYRGFAREERKKIVEKGLDNFRLTKLRDKSPFKLSIGQQQRTALLRSTIHDPPLIILDEPTASLDMANMKWFEDHILEITKQEDKLVVWTTHDLFQVKRVGARVGIMIDGTMREFGEVEEVFENPRDNMVERYLSGKLI